MSTLVQQACIDQEKGNLRRVSVSGMEQAWGCREYLQHSYLTVEALLHKVCRQDRM